MAWSGTSLRISVQESMEGLREQQWRRTGIAADDIERSRACGMHPGDIGTLRRFSARGLLLVIRCPKAAARIWHGHAQPKGLSEKVKSGSSGLMVLPCRIRVSDYDPMRLWRVEAGVYRHLRLADLQPRAGAAADDPDAEGRRLVLEVNQGLVSPIQHGCQDDFVSPSNPGVSEHDHFMAFEGGHASYLANASACKGYYRKRGLDWLYDASGHYWGGLAFNR